MIHFVWIDGGKNGAPRTRGVGRAHPVPEVTVVVESEFVAAHLRGPDRRWADVTAVRGAAVLTQMALPRVTSFPLTMMRPLVKLTSSRICIIPSQPARFTAGPMNLEQISRSLRSFLFIRFVGIAWPGLIRGRKT